MGGTLNSFLARSILEAEKLANAVATELTRIAFEKRGKKSNETTPVGASKRKK